MIIFMCRSCDFRGIRKLRAHCLKCHGCCVDRNNFSVNGDYTLTFDKIIATQLFCVIFVTEVFAEMVCFFFSFFIFFLSMCFTPIQTKKYTQKNKGMTFGDAKQFENNLIFCGIILCCFLFEFIGLWLVIMTPKNGWKNMCRTDKDAMFEWEQFERWL